MSDPDKTDKVIALVHLEKTGPVLLPEVKLTEDETIATAGVFKRFAMWLLRGKESSR